MEMLFRRRRNRDPKVLIRPCETNSAAYMPKVFGAVGSKPLLTVARLAISPAQPKLIPAVTATSNASQQDSLQPGL